jgi:hypothetical protein
MELAYLSTNTQFPIDCIGSPPPKGGLLRFPCPVAGHRETCWWLLMPFKFFKNKSIPGSSGDQKNLNP